MHKLKLNRMGGWCMASTLALTLGGTVPEGVLPEKVKESGVVQPVKQTDQADPIGALSKTARQVSEVIGLEVENGQGEKLARIKDLTLDPKSGRVSFAILASGGFMGLGDKVVAVPWAILAKGDNATYRLYVDKEDFERAPDFEKTGQYMRIPAGDMLIAKYPPE